MVGPAALLRARMESSSCSRTSRMTIDIPDSRRLRRRGCACRITGETPLLGRHGAGPDYRTAPAAGRQRRMTSEGLAPAPMGLTMETMLSRLDHARLLRYAGLFTWAVMVLPLWLISRPVEEGEAATIGAGWPAWIAWATFGVSFAWLSRALDSRRVNPLDYVLLALMIGSAVA